VKGRCFAVMSAEGLVMAMRSAPHAITNAKLHVSIQCAVGSVATCVHLASKSVIGSVNMREAAASCAVHHVIGFLVTKGATNSFDAGISVHPFAVSTAPVKNFASNVVQIASEMRSWI